MTLAAVCSFEEFLASPEINEVNMGEWSEGGLNLYQKWSKMVRTFAGRAGLWTRWIHTSEVLLPGGENWT